MTHQCRGQLLTTVATFCMITLENQVVTKTDYENIRFADSQEFNSLQIFSSMHYHIAIRLECWVKSSPSVYTNTCFT